MTSPNIPSEEAIGTVSVDSGNLIIVDPASLQRAGLLPTDAYINLCVGYSREPEYDNLAEHHRLVEGDRRKGYAPILGGLGVSLMPGLGDGEYKVTVTRTPQGRITKVELVFVDDMPPEHAE